MKKGKILVILLSAIIIFCFGLNNKISASEVKEEETTNNNPSNAEIWLEDNLGWLVGIPTGTVVAVLADILVLIKKRKREDETNKKITKQNNYTKKLLEGAEETALKLKAFSNGLNCKIDLLEDRINDNNDKVTKANDEFTNIKDEIVKLNNSIITLSNALELMATHTKELVSNGTAEEISNKISNSRG